MPRWSSRTWSRSARRGPVQVEGAVIAMPSVPGVSAVTGAPTVPGVSTAVRRAAAVLAAAVVAGLVGIGGALPALAHDELVSTDPANGATVATAPDQVTLTFTDKAIALGTEVKVTGPDGSVVSTGDPQLGPTTVAQPLVPARPAGTYTVQWRVTSADGHPVSGTFTFVASGAVGVAIPASSATGSPAAAPSDTPSATRAGAVESPAATPSASAAPSSAASPSRPSYWIVVAAVLLLAAAASALGRRRGRTLGSSTDPAAAGKDL